jgi:predicted unusual protein kinase regulating ubiquinone biosynthesis (AarF/ABC1/UbiB family)
MRTLSSRTQSAIAKGVNNWRKLNGGNGRSHTITIDRHNQEQRVQSDLFVSIPRRDITTQQKSQRSLPLVGPEIFKTSRIKALGRLFIWFTVIASFFWGIFWDRLRRRDNEVRRAVRLRQTFERAGGTFIKFGQQLSIRIDFLPWAYTSELAKMLDQVPPFPLDQAIETIERTTGQAWKDIFSVFDPEPIGSASVANVYQAILKRGEKVAIKVRRPGIGELFMTDFKVMDWLLDVAEFLTIIRPGYTQNLRKEFQATLLEELDFVQEARFQDMFRRNAKKSGKRFFTAPRINFEFSNQEVIVQEFTSGIWLWEIMAAVEQSNPEALNIMRELNIDPKKVAQRLLWANYWGMQENLIFHADPHPANVIVGQNSKLTFIDFGSCGSFNRDQRAGLEMIAISSSQDDAEGMARGTMKLIEPLPPLDVNDVFQEVEAEFTRVLTVFKSKRKHSEWWEHTSVLQWMAFFKYSREHNIPVAIHTLRMIRATLLYDTISIRICRKVDRFDEYVKFKRFREKQARKRLTKRAKRQFKRGLDDAIFLKIEDLAKTSEKLMYRTQSLLGSPIFNYSSLLGKWVYAVSVGIRLVGKVLLLTLIAGLLVYGIHVINGLPAEMWEILGAVVKNRVYQIFAVLLVIISIRQILFRLQDQEI